MRSDTFIGPDRCDCGHEISIHGADGGACRFLASGKSSPATRCACKAVTVSGVLRDETFKPRRGPKK